MDPSVKLHLGRYKRYLWEEPGLLIIIGDFLEFKTGMKLYEDRHHIESAAVHGSKEFDRLMGAAALAAISLAERESWAWTMTLPGSERGLFCAVEPEGMICGRTRPAKKQKATVHLQRQKADGPLIQSHYEPLSGDPVDTINRYFEQVEQIKTRIVLDDDCSGVLVQALPDAKFSVVEKLENTKLSTLCRQMASQDKLKAMHEVVTFYECRCTDEMILNMMTSLPDAQRKELWGNENSLTIECPRCGREYTYNRSTG